MCEEKAAIDLSHPNPKAQRRLSIYDYQKHILHLALTPQNVLFLFPSTLTAELSAALGLAGCDFPLLGSNG
jgi:hypothetical protein